MPFTQELRWLAAVFAGGPSARLSHLAAGALHGFEVRRVRPEITVPYQRISEIPGVRVHRTRRLGDLIVVSGIPVTTRPRTLLDIAVDMHLGYAELIQNTVNSGLVAIESLLGIVDRRGGRGVEGTVALRVALEGGLVDEKIEKKLELIVARIVAAARVPKPVRQYELICDDGRRVVLDNAWPDRKVTIEAPDGLSLAEGDARRSGRPGGSAKGGAASPFAQSGWSEATENAHDTRLEIESFFCEGSPCFRHGDPSQNEGEAA